jgi:RNA polymerase sigma-70 factor (ECF subfamily)
MRVEEFEQLYEEMAPPLFSFLVYRTGDRALAEDLLSDTFERALRARRRFNPLRGSTKNWLYAIALNCLRDHARHESAGQRALERTAVLATVPADADPTSDHFELASGRGDVMRALEVLSSEEREAVALRFGAGLTVPEMAKLKGEPLTTMEGRLYRALPRLRRELEG